MLLAARQPAVMESIVYRAAKFSVVRRARVVGGRAVWGEYILHPGSVAVLAVSGNSVLLVRQYRAAVEAWTLEIPAGTLEPGESPESAALREMIEETGYKPLKLTPLAEFYPTPGVSNELIKIYHASELEHVGIDRRDPGEADMEILWVPCDELVRMVNAGEIKDGKTIIAVMTALMRGLMPCRP